MVIAIGALLVRGDAMARRSALLLVAAAWLWSGAGFLMHYYGPINLPAIWFGWAFVLQGALLTVAGLFWPWNAATNRPIWSRWLMGIGWIALMGLSPLLAVAQTDNGQAAALFAVTPDVTALGAVPCMLLFPRRVRWLFLLLPLIWSLFSMATLWTLGTWCWRSFRVPRWCWRRWPASSVPGRREIRISDPITTVQAVNFCNFILAERDVQRVEVGLLVLGPG